MSGLVLVSEITQNRLKPASEMLVIHFMLIYLMLISWDYTKSPKTCLWNAAIHLTINLMLIYLHDIWIE